MKKILNALYMVLCHFALAFSGIVLFFWFFMNEAQYIDYEKILVFFRFALIFGITALIFAIPKIPYIVKTALHFVVNTIGFIVTFISATEISQMRAFVVGVFFVVAYVIVFSITRFFVWLGKKLDNKEEKAE